MPIVRKTQEMRDMPIVSLTNGEIIAKVSDVLVDPMTRSVAALISSEGGLLNRSTKIIPAGQVQVWGEDIILVSGPDVFVNREALPCQAQCLSVADQIKGREVVSQNGQRIGVLDDILIDDSGRFVGYDLSRVAIKGPLADSKRIAVEATHALGADVLVVDEAQLPV